MIRIAVVGYGNLGRGAVRAVLAAPDMTLAGVYTRRSPDAVGTEENIPVYPFSVLPSHAERIDVALLCGGSATDLPHMTPAVAAYLPVVDSFDTHADMLSHVRRVDAVARLSGHPALVGAGWDPGLFSLARLYGAAVLPVGETVTFWGRGVSQGHSDALRRVDGVIDAVEFTVPKESAVAAASEGENLPTRPTDLHRRECYIAVRDGTDTAAVARTVRDMPNYFSGYETDICFVSPEEVRARRGRLPHGGEVIRRGTAAEDAVTLDMRMHTASNPAFTGSVMTACARALYRMKTRGHIGCLTPFDIAPVDLLPAKREEVISEYM